MKSVDQIEDRVRFLLREELQRRLSEAQDRIPQGCVHNHRQPLDSRRTVAGEPNPLFNRVSREVGLPVNQTIGLCMFGSANGEWPGNICEDVVDAQRCPIFKPKRSPEEIYQQFLRDLQNEQWVVVNLPRIQPLLWVLGSRYEGLDEEPVPPPPLPWWSRVWRALWNAPPSVPELQEGGSVSVKVYLPPPGSDSDVDQTDDSPREDADSREGAASGS